MNIPHPDFRPRPARPALAKRLVIHTFVLAHLAAITISSFTGPHSTRASVQKVRAKADKYLVPTGLWQQWNMFAPNPPFENIYLEAEVTLRDGRRIVWPFPRMRHLDLFQRYLKERYRKWGQEWVCRGGHPDPLVATDAARYIARQVAPPDDPARTVELVFYRTPIPRPTAEALARPWPAEPTGWTRQSYFTCDFDDTGRATPRPQTQPSSQPTTGPTSQPAAPASAAAPVAATRPDDVHGGTKP